LFLGGVRAYACVVPALERLALIVMFAVVSNKFIPLTNNTVDAEAIAAAVCGRTVSVGAAGRSAGRDIPALVVEAAG